MNDLERQIKEQVANIPLEQEFKEGGRYTGAGRRDTMDYAEIARKSREREEQRERTSGIGGSRLVEQVVMSVGEGGLGESIGVLSKEVGEIVALGQTEVEEKEVLGKRWWDQF